MFVYRAYQPFLPRIVPLSLIAFIAALCCNTLSAQVQSPVDISAFRAMTDAQRYRYGQDIPFEKLDSATVLTILNQLLSITEEKNDDRCAFALKLQHFHQRVKLKLKQPDIQQLLSEMEKLAVDHNWAVETVVAHHYVIFEKYYQNEIPTEEEYAEVLNTFGRMEELGFEQFKDYQLESMLWDMSQFMYGLEDLEKMFEYLSVAERFIQFAEKDQYHTILILNYLQTYYQRKKDYQKALDYAQKILQFSRNLVTSHPENEWRRRFWQGLASLDIARMLAEQGKLVESEPYADEGYELSKAGYPGQYFASLRGEYDALQVLLAIKLKTGKLGEAAVLIRQSEKNLKKLEADHKFELHYFEPLKFFKNCAHFYELQDNATASLRYTRLAHTLQDSLDRRNDARKFEQIKQRLQAEKHFAQLSLVKQEKQFQQSLFYAALAILALTLALGYSVMRRLQAKRRQTLSEIASVANAFREKSEMADNLREEMNRLAEQDKRSDYLEQLTNSTILTEEDWTRFRTLFEKVHPGFIAEQKRQLPDISRAEMRVLALDKLGLNSHEIANILGISTNSVYKTRQRMEKKGRVDDRN